MATIPTPEQGKPILDFSAGTFDGNSNLIQSRNGVMEHVNGDDVADYVNTSRIYNGLETESKTPVGAINEVNRKKVGDIDDVNLSSPADGDALIYDSATGKWVNRDLENNITTRTVDGVTWTIKRNGKFYEMWADISIDTSAVTPVQWGSLYVYRNSQRSYSLPVTLDKKICDLSFSDGSTSVMSGYYTGIANQENARTSADIIIPTTIRATVVIHKYIRGYVN